MSLLVQELEKHLTLTLVHPTDFSRIRLAHIEAYAKLSLKKYSPIAARNDDLKVVSGRR
jgi:hypothetical protein